MLKLIVGSTNPVKLNAIKNAATGLSELWDVTGVEVASGVSEQPFSDSETKLGASNRAIAAQRYGASQFPGEDVLGVGLEGGVTEGEDGQLWSTVWVAVADQAGEIWTANGARMPVPEVIASLLRQGKEMGPVVAQLTGQANVKQKQGMFGIITQGYVDRTDAYSAIAKLALGIWFGRTWSSALLADKAK